MKSKISFFLLFIFAISLTTTPVHAQEPDSYPVYIIQSGDTLSSIAILFDISLDTLLQVNSDLDPTMLAPGQSVKIPGYPGITGIITPTIVDLGESWKNILIKYQIDETTLIKINKLTNTASLYAGTDLLIPVGSEGIELSPKTIVESDSGFLEKAVQLNENPYTLQIQNYRASSLFFFNTDLCFNANPDQQIVNPFSGSIESLSISPLPLTQGDTVVIHVKTQQPLSLSGQINEHELHFFTNDNENYYALQGIHAMADTGLTDFSITGTINSENVLSYQQNLLLVSGNFDTDDPLTVAPEMIDPAVTIPEMEKILAITTVFTPEKYWDGMFLSPDNDYGTVIPNYELQKEFTSLYGSRRTYNDNPEVTFHSGVDFGGGVGLPIVSVAAGKVVYAGYLDVRGNATIIDHGLGVYSAYFHQSAISVSAGEMVEKGQKIGEVGNTGRVDRADEYAGAGSHMHWEMWVNGVQVNPLDWLNSEYP